MTSLFVTGATGFIGRYLMRTLDVGQYEQICCMSRSRVLSPLTGGPFRYLTGDLCDPTSYTEQLAGCRAVVHLAATTGNARRSEHFRTNSKGTEVLLQECLNRGVRRFVHISTIAVKYNDKKYYYYAQSKELAEKAVRDSGIRAVILRPTIVLARDATLWHRLSGLVRRRFVLLPGSGRVRIQPIHVSDLVRCIQRTLEDEDLSEGLFEIGGPESTDLENFLLAVHRHRHGGGPPRIVRIPLKLFIAAMGELQERVRIPFPITAGQFSAFYNDSTVAQNPLMDRCAPSMKRLEAILTDLITDDRPIR